VFLGREHGAGHEDVSVYIDGRADHFLFIFPVLLKALLIKITHGNGLKRTKKFEKRDSTC